MMIKSTLRGALTALLLATALAAPAAAQDLAGCYEMRGQLPNGGGSYTGTTVISQNPDGYFTVIQDGGNFRGIGRMAEGSFEVSYNNDTTIAVYDLKPGGVLEGIWWTQAPGSVEMPPGLPGTERLTPVKNPNDPACRAGLKM